MYISSIEVSAINIHNYFLYLNDGLKYDLKAATDHRTAVGTCQTVFDKPILVVLYN